MMRLLFCATASLLFCCAPSAQAAIELTSFSVTSHSSDPGLVVHTSPLTAGATLSGLNNAYDSQVVDLFQIWTNESSVNADDLVAKTISVNFNFQYGSEDFTGDVVGETYGVASFFLVLPFGAGVVDWNTPVFVDFGAGQTGRLRIDFLDQLFNANLGYGELAPGESQGSTVKARFTLLTDLPVPVVDVEPGSLNAPEPATLIVWAGLGLTAAVSGWGYRRSSSAA